VTAITLVAAEPASAVPGEVFASYSVRRLENGFSVGS
jgi:hypothetical protein